MDQDPVARIAESYKTLADTQQILADTQRQVHQSVLRSEETQRLALQTQRGLAWLQGIALVMVGLSLLGTGFLVWHAVTQHVDHAALLQALRTETQTLAAQTQVLLETLRRAQPTP
jgi:hypothetical protein